MSPIGLSDLRVPVLIDSWIKADYIYIGGLHPFTKAKVNLLELKKSFNSLVCEITDEK